MLALDIIKPAPRTELEAYERWHNRLQSDLSQLNQYRVKIEVKSVSQEDTEAQITKDWPMHDPDPNHCAGRGHGTCLREGEHSWWNHAGDLAY